MASNQPGSTGLNLAWDATSRPENDLGSQQASYCMALALILKLIRINEIFEIKFQDWIDITKANKLIHDIEALIKWARTTGLYI